MYLTKSIFIMYTLKNANTEYVVAHCSRLFDGLLFLFINTSVMLLQINDVLGLFLNFAALMWDLVSVLRLDYASLYHICFYNVLKTICIYLQVFTNNRQYCIANMLRRSLMESAQDVIDMKFAVRHHYTHNCMQTFFVVLIWCGLVAVWANVHWNDNAGAIAGRWRPSVWDIKLELHC